MTNPPYDERMKKYKIEAFYKEIGDVLKRKFSGFEAWVISSNKDAVKSIGLRPTSKKTLYNGALECKFLNYSMYAGSRKKN